MEAKTESKPGVLSIKQRRHSGWVIVITAAITAALVLVGGVVAAGRLSAPDEEGPEGGFFGQRPEFQIEPAKELPTTQPTLRGLVTQRSANTLTVGQRNGGPGSNGNSNAQLMDVIVTSDTALYHDVTILGSNGQPPSGPIQQKVEPGTLDGINTNNRVTAWGEQTGNQITAKVLVYSDQPQFRPRD